ncbi:MAG: hypothetical protein L3J82_09695 [Planctomycetes bacterium]|nr:hypothetical protein [Planctomycetota bacterium]
MKIIIESDVGTLLHDLNNDLSLIVGYVDLATKCASKDDSRTTKTKLDSLKKAVERMVTNVREAQYAHKMDGSSI